MAAQRRRNALEKSYELADKVSFDGKTAAGTSGRIL